MQVMVKDGKSQVQMNGTEKRHAKSVLANIGLMGRLAGGVICIEKLAAAIEGDEERYSVDDLVKDQE